MSQVTPRESSYKSETVVRVKNTPADIDHADDTVCKTHPDRVLQLYCSFCEKPVCIKCKTSTHARHHEDIKGRGALLQASKSRRKLLSKLLEVKESTIVPRIKETIIQITESKAKLQSTLTHSIKRYKNYSKIHRDKLFIPEIEWINNVEFRASKYYQVMDEKIDFLKRLLFDVTSSLELIRRELEASNNPELLLMCGVLRSGLETFHEIKWPKEEISITLKLESVPEFGPTLFDGENYRGKNCNLEFIQDIIEPTVYSKIYDTKIPIPKRTIEDEHAKISLSSGTEMYVSFGEYIVMYPLDNRRRPKVSSNIRFLSIITVRENIIDISSSTNTNGTLLFFVTLSAVKCVRSTKKIRKCFEIKDTPSAICVLPSTDRNEEILIAFHTTGKIVKYTKYGVVLNELTHPDPKMVYRPRHLVVNNVGDIFFSDDISNITILDSNGIWKGTIGREVKTSPACGPLRPVGIACTPQRHLLILDANVICNLHIFSEDGKYLQTAVFKNIQDGYVVNVDPTGDVWVAFKDGRVRIYRPRFITM